MFHDTVTALLRNRLTVSGCATLQLKGGKPRNSNSTSLNTMFPISVKFALSLRIEDQIYGARLRVDDNFWFTHKRPRLRIEH